MDFVFAADVDTAKTDKTSFPDFPGKNPPQAEMLKWLDASRSRAIERAPDIPAPFQEFCQSLRETFSWAFPQPADLRFRCQRGGC